MEAQLAEKDASTSWIYKFLSSHSLYLKSEA